MGRQMAESPVEGLRRGLPPGGWILQQPNHAAAREKLQVVYGTPPTTSQTRSRWGFSTVHEVALLDDEEQLVAIGLAGQEEETVPRGSVPGHVGYGESDATELLHPLRCDHLHECVRSHSLHLERERERTGGTLDENKKSEVRVYGRNCCVFLQHTEGNHPSAFTSLPP